MRHLSLLILAAIALLVSSLVPPAGAREHQELRERVRDGVQRTDKDLGNLVHRDKLNEEQRKRFDAAIEDLGKLREAVAGEKWEAERTRLERAVENIDFLVKHAPIDDSDRQTLGIDLYTLQVILDSWNPPPRDGSGKI
jgi:hypothetical protein